MKITFCTLINFYYYHGVLNAPFHVPPYQKGIEPVHKALLLHGNLNDIDIKLIKSSQHTVVELEVAAQFQIKI